MNNPLVSIVICCHNRADLLPETMASVFAQEYKPVEIVVVDDGSTDNTYKLASDTGVKVIRHPYNKGYGAALKTGIRNAKMDIVLFMDADGQHQPRDIKKILSYIEEYDMVVGARTKKSKISLLRRPGKKILSITANYLAGMKIPDLNSGFRAIKKEIVMKYMHILPDTFSITTTITLAAITEGYNIKYIPIETSKGLGTSKIKPFRDGFNFILLIIRAITYFNPQKVFFPISIALFGIGLVFLLYDINII